MKKIKKKTGDVLFLDPLLIRVLSFAHIPAEKYIY